MNPKKSCWLTVRPGDTQGLKHNRETEPAGIMYNLGVLSRFGASVPTSENVSYSLLSDTATKSMANVHFYFAKWSVPLTLVSLPSYLVGLLVQIDLEQTMKNTPWADQSRTVLCQVSSLNLIAAILTPIPCAWISWKHASRVCKLRWSSSCTHSLVHTVYRTGQLVSSHVAVETDWNVRCFDREGLRQLQCIDVLHYNLFPLLRDCSAIAFGQSYLCRSKEPLLNLYILIEHLRTQSCTVHTVLVRTVSCALVNVQLIVHVIVPVTFFCTSWSDSNYARRRHGI